ncbi:hypothetical protein L1987_70741 [Smallanthus sonchifolius]|uniref:Uncharacterized protein n=1 Tax=Smallanthus sonchifolius TaxID=185202 RepID=A0ACB9AQF4_9ASTR|nr:hypothetical protein L1987_70741 [Smallanthus sonchifolius]
MNSNSYHEGGGSLLENSHVADVCRQIIKATGTGTLPEIAADCGHRFWIYGGESECSSSATLLQRISSKSWLLSPIARIGSSEDRKIRGKNSEDSAAAARRPPAQVASCCCRPPAHRRRPRPTAAARLLRCSPAHRPQ